MPPDPVGAGLLAIEATRCVKPDAIAGKPAPTGFCVYQMTL